MPDYFFTAPSKTFIVGEYAVLFDLPALILLEKPFFTLSAVKQTGTHRNPFHPESPAGQYYENHRDDFADLAIDFHDPHSGLGGFGCSSAEFVLLKKLHDSHVNQSSSPFEVLQAYQKVTEGQTPPPSGADVIAQCHNNAEIIFYNPKDKVLETFNWPFKDAHYQTHHTGNKVETHQALHLPSNLPLQPMQHIIYNAVEGIKQTNIQQLSQAINDYANILNTHKLVHEKTLEQLQSIHQDKENLCAKGCGALGADVILQISKIR